MSRLIPGSWIKAYLAYTGESESPEDYHLWVGISSIAAVLRRRVFFDMGYFLVYPNMYVVLVSPPGRCKKSTAMRIGRSLFTQIPDIEFSADSTTRERLIQDLSMAFKEEQSSLTVHSSEFASMLTSSGMDMVVFLTDIFDSPLEWTHKTKSSGTQKIRAPYLNLLAGTTPDWIAKAMPLDTIGIGLTSRVVFVYHDQPRVRDPIPVLSPEQRALEQLLVDDLKQISQISGQYFFDATADKAYREWYKSRLANPNVTGDPRLNGYYERKPIHLLKLCMIVAASKRNDTIMTMEDLEQAMELMERTENKMPNVFANVGKNPLAVDITDTLSVVLSRPGGITKAELLNMFKHSVRLEEMNEVLDTLAMIGQVVMRDGKYFARAVVESPTSTDDSASATPASQPVVLKQPD